MSTTVGKSTSGERSTSAVNSSPDRTRWVNRRIRPELSSEDDGGHFMLVEVDTVASWVFVYTSPDRSGPNPELSYRRRGSLLGGVTSPRLFMRAAGL